MQIIIAPERINHYDMPAVFLAGGITNCPDWQNEVITLLQSYQGKGTIFNPRRENFPIHDPNAAREQIEWEFYALNTAEIFSIWFCKADSDQPIAMYELGRQVALRSKAKKLDTIVIGVEPGYRRSQDIYIQMDLVDYRLSPRISNTLQEHTERIIYALALYTRALYTLQHSND